MHSLPLLLLYRKEIVTLGRLSNFQRLNRHALTGSKSNGRSGRLPRLIEGHGLRRAHGFLDGRGLLSRQPFHQQHEPPRCPHRPDSAIGQARILQQRLRPLLQRT